MSQITFGPKIRVSLLPSGPFMFAARSCCTGVHSEADCGSGPPLSPQQRHDTTANVVMQVL
jgi:hypothetical protein